MSKGHSIHAQKALERLQESYFINWFIRGDAARVDASCGEGGVPNSQYNSSLEYYLGSLQVCHAADTLNSYCQSILGAILEHQPASWDIIKTFLSKTISRDRAITSLTTHRGRDGQIRAALRDGLGSYWSPESDIVVLLRNKFVHQNGLDLGREVASEIAARGDNWCIIPPTDIEEGIPVSYSDGDWLNADAKLGVWSCAHVRMHIDLMDQNLCHRYELPRELWRPRTIGRKLGSPITPSRIPGVRIGEPLPFNPKFTNAPIETEKIKIPDLPAMPTTANKEEIECAQFMRKHYKDFITFTLECAKDLKLSVSQGGGGMPGTVLPHTIRGHDMSWKIDCYSNENETTRRTESIEFRFREEHFLPFVTVWGTNSRMQNFTQDQLLSAKEYLKECINKTPR